MPDRSRVAVLISGRGSNMAALIYASRAEDCPYEIALVTGDNPAAPGLELAEAEGIIERYEKQAENLNVLLCGGDAAFFETNLKGRIFAIPELVLVGLNSLLIENA